VAGNRTLRVATDADAAKAKPKTLAEAAEGGTYLEILVAQRREMIRDVKDVTGPAKAALHRQIGITSKEIAALQAEAEQEATEDAEVADEAFDPEAL
jgi:hypothetical protein